MSARDGTAPSLIAWPPLETDRDLQDLRRLTDWNFRPWLDATGGHILLPVASGIAEEDGDGVLVTNAVSRDQLGRAEAILGWNQAEWLGQDDQRVLALDPYMDRSATDNANRFVQSRIDDPEQIVRDWTRSVARLMSFVDGRDLLLIGSGPTTEAEREAASERPLCPLFLGTAIFDRTLRTSLPPGLLFVADGLGQMSDLPASRRLLDIIRSELDRGAHLVVPQELGPLARTVLPKALHDHIHAVPMGGAGDDLWRTGRARPLANVLTTLGLPVAATLAGPGGRVGTLGISFTSGNTAGDLHWSRRNVSPLLNRQALELLVHEPGSVLADPDYRARHFANLKVMTDNLAAWGLDIPGRRIGGRSSPPPPPRRTSFLSKIVAAVDHVERWRHRYAMMAIALFLSATAGLFAVAGVTVTSLLLAVSVLILLTTIGTGVLLRLRLHRWMHTFERRRRQMEALELERLTARLDDLESRMDRAD